VIIETSTVIFLFQKILAVEESSGNVMYRSNNQGCFMETSHRTPPLNQMPRGQEKE